MTEDFEDKIVLVTGAGSTDGRSVALAFASRGARLALNDLTPVHLDPLVAEIRAGGGSAEIFDADIAKKIPAQTLVMAILERWERIDILVNNARVRPRSSILEMDEWDWRRMIDVNLTGAFLMTQIVGRVMRSALGGSIVHIASPGHSEENSTERTAFEAGVSGLLGLTKAAAFELGPHNIRVNAILPDTSASERLSGKYSASDSSLRLPHIPGVEAAVLYLCSAEATSLNGQIVIV